MTNETKTAPLATAPAPKAWKYVGPGSEERGSEREPLIGNLPIDLDRPRDGYLSERYLASQLPEKYIEYVMETVPAAKGWWKK